MKKKNGFTLVELLAVIVVLAIIIGIAIPASMLISNRTKKKMFCKKITMLEQTAVLYGQDNFNMILNAGTEGVSVRVDDLVLNGYLKKDVKEAELGDGTIINPMDSSSMDDYQIKIYINNNISKNRVRATCIDERCNICED